MLRILIVEPESSGHHFSLYLKLIVKSLNNKVHIHLLTSSDSRFHPAFETVMRESGGNLTTHLLAPYKKSNSNATFNLFIQQCKLYFKIKESFKEVIKEFVIDKVFFVNIDHIEKALSIFGSPFGKYPYAGIFMNPKFHKYEMGIGSKSRNDKIYKFLFKQLLKQKTLKTIGTVDETFANYYNKNKKIKFIPEPFDLNGTMNRQQARDAFGFSEEKFVILVYGDLTLRKGIRELINGIHNNGNSNICLHFVGKTNDDTETYLKDKNVIKLIKEGRLYIKRGFQTETEQYVSFISSDIVWVGYSNGFSGSSGVYYQASSLGIPVIVNDFGLLGWLVKKHKNGIACDIYNSTSINNSVNLLVENRTMYYELSNNALLMSKNHQPEMFSSFVYDIIATS